MTFNGKPRCFACGATGAKLLSRPEGSFGRLLDDIRAWNQRRIRDNQRRKNDHLLYNARRFKDGKPTVPPPTHNEWEHGGDGSGDDGSGD